MNCKSEECSEQAIRGGYCDDHQKEHFRELELKIQARKDQKGTKAKPISFLKPHLPKNAMDRPRTPTSTQPYKHNVRNENSKRDSIKRCKLEFCNVAIRKDGAVYCSWHLRHFQAGLPLTPIPKEKPTVCEVPSCSSEPHGAGFCRLHSYQLSKHGKIYEVVECSRDGCTNMSLPDKLKCRQCQDFKVYSIEPDIGLGNI